MINKNEHNVDYDEESDNEDNISHIDTTKMYANNLQILIYKKKNNNLLYCILYYINFFFLKRDNLDYKDDEDDVLLN